MITFSLIQWCVLVACLLPILCAGIARFGPSARGATYDNADPRGWLARQSGWRGRANAAQANSFEALPFFIGALVLALHMGADPARMGLLAVVFVSLRLVYIGLYLADKAALRTLVWTAALLVNVAILFAGGS